jgi:hypothetical protein
MSARLAALGAATIVLLLVVPAGARANPSVAVSILTSSNMNRFPASVTHRLTMTAAPGRAETLTVSGLGRGLAIGGQAQVLESRATGAGVARCAGRWSALHDARRDGTTEVRLRIAPGGVATADLRTAFAGRPWLGEGLNGTFTITPEGGRAYSVTSRAAAYTGPISPELSLRVVRSSGRHAVITGDARGVRSGRVELWAYAPSRRLAQRIATVGVRRGGRYSYAGWRPRRAGRWELYARYRRTRSTPVRGATECGRYVQVRNR